ncbi:MAG: thioredoxin-related protein [Oceanospirillaceae bacterium]|jgi:thioredoxin-related protein|tara:strand:+ start:337 stop:819 length:483 start_codon:yes stop_codon:yes gene_type:complete
MSVGRDIKHMHWLLLLILWLPAGHANAEDAFPMLQDSRLLQPDRVLVLLAEVENCSFCKRVKDDFLLPLTMDPEWAPLFQVMLIDLNSQQMLTDFSAQRISQQDLAAALSADFSPTLIFLNPRSGERIGEDIVGLVTPDFYGFYLQQQIAQSYDLLTGQL